MKYQEAVRRYQASPDRHTLDLLAHDLCRSMSLKEKTRMLSGGFFAFGSRIILGRILHGSIFHYPFAGSGCRRLGVPGLNFSDGPRGAVTGHSTCFPVAMARAASFDPELEYRVGTAIAREARAAGANFFAGICLNLVRNPRWGRSQESWGEDPWLMACMGEAMVRAVQDRGLIACPKHFALNSIENLRFEVSAETDERSLREIWLPHFRRAVDAGALAIMSAYNKVNGEYCGENRNLLTDMVRDEWNFDGLVMSDFIWGVHDTAGALKAGMDWEMPVPFFYSHGKIKKALRDGLIVLEDVDRAVCRMLRVLVRQVPALEVPDPKAVKCGDHLELAGESAARSMVLLKNSRDLLPLPRETRLAVVGPFADRLNLGDRGSSMIVPGREAVSSAKGLKQFFDHVEVAGGTDIKRALRASSQAEVVIACLGCDHRDEGEFLINPGKGMASGRTQAGTGGDRDSLDLPPEQLALLEALGRTGKKVVVVLHTGSVILTRHFEACADAIVMAWYGGVRFGSALGSLISGQRNFSGRLPVSIAINPQDYPGFPGRGEHPPKVEYGYYSGYWHLAKEGALPAYPFGFGLGYTTFSLVDAEAETNARGGITVRVTVRNTGTRTGVEVVQVYAGSACPEVDGEHRPRPMLKGFRPVELQAGESKRLEIVINREDLQFWDSRAKAWKTDPACMIQVGSSSADTRLGAITVRMD